MGSSREDIDAALLAWDTSDASFRSGADDEELMALVEQYRDKPWFRYFVFVDPRLVPFGRLIWNYEPLPVPRALPFSAACDLGLGLNSLGSSHKHHFAAAPAFSDALASQARSQRRLHARGESHGARANGKAPVSGGFKSGAQRLEL